MVFKNLNVIVLWMKVASAFEGLSCLVFIRHLNVFYTSIKVRKNTRKTYFIALPEIAFISELNFSYINHTLKLCLTLHLTIKLYVIER